MEPNRKTAMLVYNAKPGWLSEAKGRVIKGSRGLLRAGFAIVPLWCFAAVTSTFSKHGRYVLGHALRRLEFLCSFRACETPARCVRVSTSGEGLRGGPPAACEH